MKTKPKELLKIIIREIEYLKSYESFKKRKTKKEEKTIT